MRILPPVEEQVRRAIRDERAKDPLISITKLQEKLERTFGREFRRTYLTKLSDKVGRQALVEIDSTKIEERLAFTRENYRMMREELLKIVYWKPKNAQSGIPRSTAKDRRKPRRALSCSTWPSSTLRSPMGCTRKTWRLRAKEVHYEPLPGEVRAIVIAAWQRGGLLPDQILAKMIPAKPLATAAS
jgi:hypothetical protein